MNRYQVGDAIRFRCTFRNLAGAIADPTGVTFRFRNGTGAITVYTYGTDPQLVRESTGVYYVDLSPNAAGTWHVAFRGTGAVIAAAESSVLVETRF